MTNDVNQIRNLSHFYAKKVDSADFEAIGAVFANGATECFLQGARNGGRCTGSERSNSLVSPNAFNPTSTRSVRR